jgi:hypothetical protein
MITSIFLREGSTVVLLLPYGYRKSGGRHGDGIMWWAQMFRRLGIHYLIWQNVDPRFARFPEFYEPNIRAQLGPSFTSLAEVDVRLYQDNYFMMSQLDTIIPDQAWMGLMNYIFTQMYSGTDDLGWLTYLEYISHSFWGDLKMTADLMCPEYLATFDSYVETLHSSARDAPRSVHPSTPDHVCTGTGARPCHICTGTWAHPTHICTGTGTRRGLSTHPLPVCGT